MTANPRQGWRITADSATKLHRTEAGRFSLPAAITDNGQVVAKVGIVLTSDEIEALFHAMRRLAGTRPTTPTDGDSRTERRASLF